MFIDCPNEPSMWSNPHQLTVMIGNGRANTVVSGFTTRKQIEDFMFLGATDEALFFSRTDAKRWPALSFKRVSEVSGGV